MEFDLLKSLRQHFAALDQQVASSQPLQTPATLSDPSTMFWLQSCQLQSYATPEPAPSKNLCQSSTAVSAQSGPPATALHRNLQLASQINKSFRSSAILHKSKAKHNKRHKDHKQRRLDSQQGDLSSILEISNLQSQGHHIHHAKSVHPFFQQDLSSSPSTVAVSSTQEHLLQNACRPCVDQPQSPDKDEAPQLPCKAHKNRSLVSFQMADAQQLITEQATASNSNVCIRAKPKLAWQRTVKPAAGIYVTTDLCLGHIHGRQTVTCFQIASDLGKAGQLRTQNLHAAVKASKQLMHRFVVHHSAVAHMGVFTKGACLAALCRSHDSLWLHSLPIGQACKVSSFSNKPL